MKGSPQQAHPRFILGFIDALRHLPGLDPEFHQTRSQAQHPSRRVSIAKAARVRDEGCVQTAGDVGVDHGLHLIKDERNLLTNGGGGEVDVVDVAGRVVVVVVIHPAKNPAAGLLWKAAAQTIHARSIDDHGGVKALIAAHDVDDVVSARKPGKGQRIGFIVVHEDVFAHGSESTRQREGRADHVAIGTGVPTQQHPLCACQRVRHLLSVRDHASGQVRGETAEGFTGSMHGVEYTPFHGLKPRG